MNEDQYIKERLDDQINWYDEKSAIQKKYYYRAKATSTIITASIPVLTGFILSWHPMLYIISIIAAISLVIEGLMSMTKVHEKWLEYRSIVESLKHEKYMYLVKAGVYANSDNNFEFFVERIESIISQENINWANLGKSELEDKK